MNIGPHLHFSLKVFKTALINKASAHYLNEGCLFVQGKDAKALH